MLSELNTNDCYKSFIDNISLVCCNIIPKKKQSRHYISQFFRDRKALMRKRTKILKKCNGTVRRQDEEKLQDLEKLILQSHKDEQSYDEAVVVNKIRKDPNFFFRYAKKFSLTNQIINCLSSEDGLLINDKDSICKLFLKQFNSVFSKPNANKIVHDSVAFFNDIDSSQPHMNTITINEATITEAISEISGTSACGPDGMQASFFKNCSKEIVAPLIILFNKSLNEGVIPDVLKRAAILPVFKNGDRSIPANYKPISLTPILMKIFERIARKQIVNFLSQLNIFNPTQHGFREGRSCLSALLGVYDDIMSSLSEGSECVDMVYLDFAKAFDKVDHGILLHKLRDFGISGKLGIWLHSLLLNRSQFVRIPGGFSTDSQVISGVPQGTVLGPLLFLILMSDINKGVSNTKIISFADDTRVYNNIKTVDDCNVLQSDLESVYNWADVNNMLFNASKFDYLSFACKNNSLSSNVYVNPDLNIINQHDNIKDLGILMSSDCSFEKHILSVSSRCSRLAGWILRTFASRDKITMLTLFKSLVLSRLDYGSQLGSPFKAKDIRLLESVQRAFTKHIQGMHTYSYADRLSMLKLYSLQRRRDRYTIIYVWKILESIVPNLNIPITCYSSIRRGRLCETSHVGIGHLGTLVYHSFRFRGIRLFNVMPKQIRDLSCSVSSFKYQLDKYLSTIPDTPCIANYDNSLENSSHTNPHLLTGVHPV